LDTFLNNEKCIVYGSWDKIDRQFYLSTVLEGAATQIQCYYWISSLMRITVLLIHPARLVRTI